MHRASKYMAGGESVGSLPIFNHASGSAEHIRKLTSATDYAGDNDQVRYESDHTDSRESEDANMSARVKIVKCETV